MKTLFHILSFEWKSLRRSSTLKVLVLVVLGAGIYGIYFGKFEIDKQERQIAQVQRYEQQQFADLIRWAKLDTTTQAGKEKYVQATSPAGGDFDVHFTYYVTHEAPPLAGLCLGQRDLFPVYYGINVGDLARQTNGGELANPMKLLTGNFDLSYVLVFLLPVLIVGLFYDLYAGEKEGGTLSLLQSQPTSLSTVLLAKGLLRLLVVLGLATLLVVLAFGLQGISLRAHYRPFLQWLGIIYGYCLLWTALMGLIVWLRRSTALSAILGLAVWLIFTLVTPALLNLLALAEEPLPNRAEAINAVRTLSDKMWASPKSFVLNKFYQENPRYRNADTTNFDQWYYASFPLLDEEASALNATFETQVARRNHLLRQWEWLAPAALVHEKLSSIAQTDRESHRAFMERVQAFHQKLEETYYPKIFSSQAFDQADLENLSTFINH